MKTIISLLLLMLSLNGISQNDTIPVGVYKTGEDFLLNKIVQHHKHVKTKNLFVKKIYFSDSLDNPIVYNFRKDSLWGHNDMYGNTVRWYKSNHWTVLTVGKICVFGKYGEFLNGQIVDIAPNYNSNGDYIGGIPKVYISNGIDGKLIKGNRMNLKILLAECGESPETIEAYNIPRLYYLTLIEWIIKYNKSK